MGRYQALRRSCTVLTPPTPANPITKVVMSVQDLASRIDWHQSVFGDTDYEVYDIEAPETPIFYGGDTYGIGDQNASGGTPLTPMQTYQAKVTFLGYPPVLSAEYYYVP